MFTITQKLKKAAFLLLFILLYSIQSFSQTNFRPGYYITWNNDTIRGLVDYRGEARNSKVCVFKATEHANPQQFQPKDILGYRFIDSKYYVSREIDIKNEKITVFLEFLVDGIKDLYFLNDINYYGYYIEYKNGELFRLTSNNEINTIEDRGQYEKKSYRYIGLLKANLADCKEIQPEINNIKLEHKSLISVMKNYHNYVCDGETCIVYEKKLPFLRVKLSPLIGVSISTFDIENGFYDNFKFDSNISSFAGLRLNLWIPRLNEKLSIQIESAYCQSYYFSYHEKTTKKPLEFYDAHYRTDALNTSMALKYTYPKGKIRPTIAIGAISTYILNHEQKIIFERKYNDIVYTYEQFDIPEINILFGGMFQIGCEYKIFDKVEIFSNLKYSKCVGRKSEVLSKIGSINFSTGIYLSRK